MATHQRAEHVKEEFMKTGLDKAKEEAREKFIERMKEARRKQKEEKEKTQEHEFTKHR